MTQAAVQQATSWVPDDSAFGARLALVRQRMGWGNIAAAADACSLPAESWRTWERDNVTPRKIVDIARVISEVTGCDYIWLLTGGSASTPQQRSKDTFLGMQSPTVRPIDTRPKGRPTVKTSPGVRRPARISRPVA